MPNVTIDLLNPTGKDALDTQHFICTQREPLLRFRYTPEVERAYELEYVIHSMDAQLGELIGDETSVQVTYNA